MSYQWRSPQLVLRIIPSTRVENDFLNSLAFFHEKRVLNVGSLAEF
jgi:hypothetical protein